MRLRRLDLRRYGRFTDASLDFGARPVEAPDLTVIYGANEAGKSTALSAWLDLLYGIPERSPLNFLHDYANMEIGALVETGDGMGDGPLSLTRRKRRDAALLDGEGRTVDQARMERMLHGLGRDAYRAMFSLDDRTLEEGGREILQSGGELGRLLFSAASGLSDLTTGLDALRAEADGFHRPGASKVRLAALRRELKDLTAERTRLDTTETAWRDLTTRLADAETDYQTALAARSAARQQAARVEARITAREILAEITELEARRPDLPAAPDIPEGWADEARAMSGPLANSRAAVATERQRLSDLETESAAVPPGPDPILTRAAEIAAAHDAMVNALKALEDLPRRRRERAEVRASLAEITARLGAEPGTDAEALAVPEPILDALDRAMPRDTRLVTEAETAAAELAKAEAALADLAADGDGEAEAPPPLTPLLNRLRDEAPERRRADAASALGEAEAALSRRIQNLAPWQGDGTALSHLALPAAETAQRWRDRDADLTAREEKLSATGRETEAERARLEAERSALVAGDAPPDDRTAEELRAARDRAWVAHLARLDGMSAAEFAAAMGEDDRAQALRLAASATLAELRRIDRRLAELSADMTSLAAEGTAVAAERAALDAESMPALEALGLGRSVALADLPGWLSRAGEALAALERQGAALRAVEAADRALDAARRALAEALGQPESATSLRLLMAEAEVEDEARSRRRNAAETARSARAAARRDLVRRRQALEEARGGAEAHRAEIAGLLSGTWLSTRGVEAVADMLPALRQLWGELPLNRKLARQIESMESDIAAATATAEALGAELGEAAGSGNGNSPSGAQSSLPSRSEEAANGAAASDNRDAASACAAARESIQHLSARLAEAERAVELRARIARDREASAGRLREAEDSVARHEARIAEMTDALPRGQEIDGLPALQTALAEIADYRRISEDIARRERQLARTLGLPDREAAEAELGAEDQAALLEARAEAAAAQDAAEAEHDRQRDARTRAADALAAVGGDDAPARLSSRIAAVEAEMLAGAERMLSLRLGLAAAERAIAAYRDRHRSAMLARTAEAFRTVTGGAFADLKPVPARDGERLLAIRETGGSLEEDGMSKGTAFQLYLALRVAGHAHMAESAGPLPFVADDILETFDDDRAARAFALMAEIGRRGQAIYLTHHRHLCAIAREVLGPEARIIEMPA